MRISDWSSDVCSSDLEGIVEAQKFEGGSIKHDVAVAVSRVPEFIARATALVEAMVSGIRPVPFGHVGDGNIHFNLSQLAGAERAAYLARWVEVSRAVHELVVEMEGSISAAHGIGYMKLSEYARFQTACERALLRRLQQAFDPEGLKNPGQVI